MTCIRRARVQHTCTERSYHKIMPGDLYLNAVCTPWHDMNSSKTWWVIKACLRCAKEFGLHTSDTLKRIEQEATK